ncbi:MAG: YciE/YciF ferroxidase family protein [Solirubrobacteraceae bacterium]
MFERLNTPEEAYNYKLGAALKMEHTVLDILDESISEATRDRVRQMFSEHRAQTERHVANLEQAFGLLGWEVDDSPCPAIQGIEKEAKANVKRADDALVDSVLLEGAVEVEHHEIGVYENLIIHARAMRRDDVLALLEENLAQETQTLNLAKQAQEVAVAA